MPASKQCRKCAEYKDKTAFYFDKTKGKHKTICKACDKRASTEWYKNRSDEQKSSASFSYIKRKYGLSKEQYLELLVKTGNICHLCNREMLGRDRVVDHCHITGKVRSIICNKCNIALGLVNDNVTTLQNMILYLEVHADG